MFHSSLIEYTEKKLSYILQNFRLKKKLMTFVLLFVVNHVDGLPRKQFI